MAAPRRAVRPSRTEPDEPGTREKILDVAEDLIARKGLEGLRLKELAETVGIRTPSLFAHFAGRDAIAAAVSRRLLDTFSIPGGPGDDPVEELRRSVENFVGHLVERPAHARLLLRELAQAGSAGLYDDEETSLLAEEQDAFVAEWLREGMRRGVFRPVRPDAVIALLLGAATANVAWQGWDELAAGEVEVSAEVLKRETAELIVRYVLP